MNVFWFVFLIERIDFVVVSVLVVKVGGEMFCVLKFWFEGGEGGGWF